MAKPKLALIPAAQGTKLFSVLPSDGTGDFDFTRGSVATRINAQGLIENVASGQSRLDYPLIDGVQKGCPHHILEPARTNLIADSIEISQFTQSNTSVIDNNIISPEGTLNASKVTEQNVSGVHYVGAGLAGGAGEYTWSCFLKQGTSRYAGMRAVVNAFQNRFFVNVDLSNGSVVDTHTVGSGTTWEYYVHKYPNGWYRLVIQAANGSGNMDMSISSSNVAQPNYSLGLPTYLGSTNNNFYVWGAQFEAGAFETSFIKTTGTAVTRSAETATGAGNATTFNDSQGVLMIESATLSESDITARYFQLSDGSITANGLTFRYYTTTNYFQALYYTNGAYQSVLSIYLPDSSEFNKIAFKYKANDFALWVNGIKVGSDATGSTGYTLSNLSFNNNGFDSFEGSIKQLQYFDSALADTQLEQLTSWQSFTDMAEGQLYTIE